MSVGIVTSPQADDDIRTIDEWWRANRPAAPALFAEELTEAMVLLAASPEMGRRYRHPRIPELRRIILRASRYHVYYVLADDLVTVLAVWSAVRGRGPKLPHP
jgi:plasmid stabilization system protein ParE